MSKKDKDKSKNKDKVTSSSGGRKADVDDQTKSKYKSESVHEGAKQTNDCGTQNLGDSEDQGYEENFLDDKEDYEGSPESGMGGT